MTNWTAEERQILPVLPLIYVAWADGELTPEEISAVRTAANCLDDVTPEACRALDPWLDPNSPPTPEQLRDLRLKLAEVASTAQPVGDVFTLGQRLAQEPEVDGAWSTPEARDALERLREAFGFHPSESLADILPSVEAPAAVDRATPYSVEALGMVLDGVYHEQREAVRALLRRDTFEPPPALAKENYRELVLEWTRALANEGVGALAYPGVTSQKDLGHFIASFETLAHFDLSLLVKTGVQFGLFGGSIYFLGTERHHQRFLSKAASLELPGCFAMTEVGHGSNVRELETTATYDPSADSFTLHTPSANARKEWIGNAATHGQWATVFAQLRVGGEEHGVHAFVVPIRDADGNTAPGVRIEDCGHKLGLNGVDNGRLWFDEVSVPREDMLDRFARVHPGGTYESPIASPTKRFFTMLSTLVGGRVSVGAAAVSISKSALTVALRYGERRRQFGPVGQPETALLDYRAHQHQLLRRLATTYALNFALHELIDDYSAADPGESRELETQAAALKAYATAHCTDTVQACRECCGGQGYASVNQFAAWKADSDVFTTFEGDNTVLLQLVARGLLSDLRAEFSNMRWYDMVRHLSGAAIDAIEQKNPITSRSTDHEHLMDPVLHADLLQGRVRHLTMTLGQRLKKRIEAGIHPFDAVNQCQLHALSLGQAYAEALCFERFTKHIEGCEDGEVTTILQLVSSTFALDCLTRDRAWYLENGFFEPVKSKAIRGALEDALLDLRPHALALTDAFRIPEKCLWAPIASRE